MATSKAVSFGRDPGAIQVGEVPNRPTEGRSGGGGPTGWHAGVDGRSSSRKWARHAPVGEWPGFCASRGDAAHVGEHRPQRAAEVTAGADRTRCSVRDPQRWFLAGTAVVAVVLDTTVASLPGQMAPAETVEIDRGAQRAARRQVAAAAVTGERSAWPAIEPG